MNADKVKMYNNNSWMQNKIHRYMYVTQERNLYKSQYNLEYNENDMNT